MRIWHDDIRRPPDKSWIWARTNDAAQDLLETSEVSEISLDHDLGLDGLDPYTTPDADYLQGKGVDTGADLISWMLERNLVPEKIEIHSWSEAGRLTMARLLSEAGHAPVISPFDPDCRTKR